MLDRSLRRSVHRGRDQNAPPMAGADLTGLGTSFDLVGCHLPQRSYTESESDRSKLHIGAG